MQVYIITYMIHNNESLIANSPSQSSAHIKRAKATGWSNVYERVRKNSKKAP